MSEKGAPPLADLVRAGETQTEAIAITDSIFMAKDISNAYLLTGADGDVLINSGFTMSAARNKALFASVRKGPLRAIIVTQAHPDHYGGVPVLREPGTQIVTQERFPDTWRYFDDLHDYLSARSGKLWAFNRKSTPPRSPEVKPDITVDRHLTLDVGGRTIEIFATPGGETLCGLTVWLPEEKTAFTGNLFGPVFRAIPNIVTVRGDKPRLVDAYLRSLDLVRSLGPELLITGHGDPIVGRDRIKADLDTMHGAVSYLREQVITGMNAGKTVHQLMREVRLPDALTIGEFHGKVSWAIRSIWDELSGWFHYEDGTAGLYDVPRSAIDADLAELAGVEPLVTRGKDKLAAGQPLEALHLLDIVLASHPAYAEGLIAKKAALQLLLDRSGGTNLSEVMWLKNEITLIDQALG